MHHQPQFAIANGPDRCADSPRAEILHAQLYSNVGAMAERSSVNELRASSRSIACCRGYPDANERHDAVGETELPITPIIDDSDRGFGNCDNTRSRRLTAMRWLRVPLQSVPQVRSSGAARWRSEVPVDALCCSAFRARQRHSPCTGLQSRS